MDIPVGGIDDEQLTAARRNLVITRDELLAHYRHLRTISIEFHTGALLLVAPPTLLQHAKRLGLAAGRRLIADSELELTLVFDLAVHTARDGRSRAIDRYAKSLSWQGGCDRARVLEAMQRAKFSVWKVEGRHPVAGLMVYDLLRDEEVWLIDEGLERSTEKGTLFASRLCSAGSFAMTCGVIAPMTDEIVNHILMVSPAWHINSVVMAEDPRLAAGLYRAAIDSGTMDRVIYT